MNKASFSRLAFTVIIVALAVILLLWGYFMGPEYLRHQPWHALLLRPPGLIVFAIGALTLLRGKTRQVLLFIFALLITIPFLLHRINGAPYLIFAIPTGLLALVVFIALTRRRDWCAWAFWLYLLITIALLPIIYFFAAMGHAFESSSPLPQQTVFRLGAVLLLPGIVIYALKWNYFRNGAGKAVAAPPLPAAPVETAPANTEIKSERSYLVVGLGLSMIPITQLILPFSWRYPWLAAITGVAVACLALAALLKPAQIPIRGFSGGATPSWRYSSGRAADASSKPVPACEFSA